MKALLSAAQSGQPKQGQVFKAVLWAGKLILDFHFSLENFSDLFLLDLPFWPVEIQIIYTDACLECFSMSI